METNRINNEMLLQRANLLSQRLDQGQISASYEHLSGSKDLLREVKDKYDDLAKGSYFTPDVQVGWKLKIVAITDQLNAQQRAEAYMEDDEKSKRMMRKKTLSHIESNKIPELHDALDYSRWFQSIEEIRVAMQEAGSATTNHSVIAPIHKSI